MGGVGARPQGILRRNFQLRYCARESLTWARLLKRVFDIDIEHCPNCGGSLKSIAVIEDPPVIVKILAHLGLPTRPATLPCSAIRSDNLRSRKPVANASRRRRSLELRASGVIRHTSRASDCCAARAGRSNIGIFIKQKDD